LDFDVIVLDLDGTLLRNDKTVSAKTLEALKNFEKMGKQIVIATARPPRLAGFTLPEELQREFMIFYNGAEIYHNKQKIYSKYISMESVNSIRKFLTDKNNECRVCFEINNRLYSNFDVEGFFGKIEHELIDLSIFELLTTTKILIDTNSIDNIAVFESELPHDCTMIVTDNGSLGQIMAQGVNKLNALKEIIEKLGTSLDRVLFFGDDINDIELIKECGIGVAMGNAASEVKEAADYVTTSNEEDGIAVFLKKFSMV
jgi:Cof subfamily protein (haloacid dehalogenase superfamily)